MGRGEGKYYLLLSASELMRLRKILGLEVPMVTVLVQVTNALFCNLSTWNIDHKSSRALRGAVYSNAAAEQPHD